MAFISISYAKTASAQDVLDKHVTVTVQNTEIKKVIVQLQNLTDAKFIYSSQTINANRKISLSVIDKSLKELLDNFFVPLGIEYKTIDDKILLYHSNALQITDPPQLQTSIKAVDKTVSGTVTNATGQPLAGVSITIKGTTKGAVTDGFGHFQINVPDDNAELVVSYVGY
ncbi:MAG TPA: carboxypeptidase-like regulatory domain-containing protein, partial [Parafilimonas sp.]